MNRGCITLGVTNRTKNFSNLIIFTNHHVITLLAESRRVLIKNSEYFFEKLSGKGNCVENKTKRNSKNFLSAL